MSFSLSPHRSETREIEGAPRLIEYSHPTPDFWKAWRGAKDSLKSLGYFVFKDPSNHWQAGRVRTLPEGTPASDLTSGYQIRDSRFRGGALTPWQVAGAGTIVASLHKHGHAIDGGDPGVGKTYMDLASVREIAIPFCVICPSAGIANWKELSEAFGLTPLFIANWEAARAKSFRFGGFDSQGDYAWRMPSNTVFIFDEAHKAKGDYSLNCKMLLAAKRERRPLILSTATLATGPHEMRGSGFVLGFHDLTDYPAWKKSWNCFENSYGRWECADAVSIMKEIGRHIFPLHGSRVSIAELGDAFPETQISADCYDIGKYKDAQNEAYADLLSRIKEIERDIRGLRGRIDDAVLHGGDPTSLQETVNKKRALSLEINMRYRQISEKYKIEILCNMAKDAVENNLSVAIFCNYTDTIEKISEILKCPKYYGEQSSEENEAAKKSFQGDEARVLILNTQSGGVSLSLHDVNGKHPRLSLISPTFSAYDLKQVLGRVRRTGGKSKSLQRIIYATGTIEEEVCRRVRDKIRNIDALNDGDLMEKEIFSMGENE